MTKLLIWLVFAIPVQDDIVKPEEASQHVGKTVTIEMNVSSSRFIKDTNLCFLNSQKDHREDGNFAIVIREAGLKSFADAKVSDPAEHFKSKIVRVKGKVELFKQQPQIVVDKADQIELVDDNERVAEAAPAAEEGASEETEAVAEPTTRKSNVVRPPSQNDDSQPAPAEEPADDGDGE